MPESALYAGQAVDICLEVLLHRLEALQDVDVAYFLVAAKGTPQPIVDKLSGAIDRALQNPKVKETLLAQGIEEKRGTPSEVGAYLAGEVRRWGDFVKLSAPAAAGK